MIFSLFLENEAVTNRFGEDFALALGKGDLVTLEGDLGAGKTSFARAIIRTLADDDTMDVPSPTFTLVQTYDGTRLPVIHADLYRINEPEEIDELGFDEARENGIILVEWPEKAEGGLGRPDFSVFLAHEGEGRRINVKAEGKAGERFERSLQIRTFLQKNNRGHFRRRYFTGDASARSYELVYGNNRHEILMNAPEMEMPEASGQSYADIAHLGKAISQFIGIDRLILENGFTVPKIAAQDIENGLLISDDLGRDGILDKNRKPITHRYIESVKLLAAFHQKKWLHHRQFDDLTLDIPNYDKGVLKAEVSLLLDWYVPYIDKAPSTATRNVFFDIWQPLFEVFEQSEKTFVMRDYHSPNIIWRDNETGLAKIGLIDFQDGQIGPTAYDVVSLAQDARVAISRPLEKTIVEAYCQARKQDLRPFDEGQFKLVYAIAGAQRASKILGIFVRLDRRDGKSGYLQHFPNIRDYLKRNLEHPALAPLREFYLKAKLIDD
ncbi:tRNA (adenosine(37)-N6)-threonylcarbamoyltransferase complex ATPase subunit type 1 TsaE [uncultured Bartonella sp.]|uniref:tRNA (adenosine(37)-N6)-threonylcarbamoyltransferase complex ATPase subunit type 1 TsaE n=1 Tax=uncultured Bartonella sp. TaxID=104108 RepID=UPI002636D86E|nr:tRNA (adenosine(37)-N6)-threonylcarbamoyltransferase complex ATPase subunit type 1 TsaE [uncultured Bartonella sp.]